MEKSASHDAKIMSLALLLSSLFIYNSVGTIDEQALDRISFIANLSKLVQLNATSKGRKKIEKTKREKE